MHRLLRAPRSIGPYVLAGGLVFVVDRLLKYFALQLETGSIAVIGDIARFSLLENRVMAFGLPLSVEWTRILSLFIFAAIVVIAIRTFRRPVWQTGALIIVLFGALSNLIDRFYYGFVVDYIDIYDWSVFNLADVLIFAGLLMVLLYKSPNKSPNELHTDN